MKTMWLPSYYHSCFVATHPLGHMMYMMHKPYTLCAQMHELPQSECSDNQEGTLFS